MENRGHQEPEIVPRVHEMEYVRGGSEEVLDMQVSVLMSH